LHALWAQHGLGKLDPTQLAKDPDPRVRAATARWLPSLATDLDEQVRLQAALSLNGDIVAGTNLLLKNDSELFRIAVLSSFAGKEVELLKSLIAASASEATLRFVSKLIEAASSKPTATPKKPSRTFTSAEQKRLDHGSTLYQTSCGLCHMINGFGIPNLAPPLSENPWVTGGVETLTRIALQGLHGPIQVGDQTWNLVMPGQAENPSLDDAALADVLSYIRNAFGNDAGFISPDQVAKIRAATKDRHLPWTVEELSKAKAAKP
jgi:mono/diheme cytochrome c family protein